MKLIFIHGRAQQGRSASELLKEWQAAWEIGLNTAKLVADKTMDIRVPFYGYELDRLVHSVDGELLANVKTRGVIADEELAFRAQVLDEMATAEGIGPGEIDAYYQGLARERGLLNLEWVQAMLRALDKTPLGAKAIDQFTHDVWVYLRYSAVRTAIDSIVAAELQSGTCVVVGHSLGSVVGYNVLRAAGSALQVPRYITIGSPLGIGAIQNLLDLPLEMPSCTTDWYNAMDQRDVVALRPLDHDSFPIKPAIRNKTNVNNKTHNRHGITGYLDDPDVAREIYTALHAGS